MSNKNKESYHSPTKILVLDIETAPLESYTWGTFEQDVGLDQIKTEWSILSFAAKWLHNPKVIYKSTGGRGKRYVRHDKPLLKDLWQLLDEADIVVSQNGKAFDIKKVNARMAMHGILPYSPIKQIDTLVEAKKHFKFTSNRLAWLSKYLSDTKKSEHKKFPGFSLWLECLQDNPKAWAEMKKYNIIDILATEQVYFKLRPWMNNHPNISQVKGVCHSCGGTEFNSRGWNLQKNHKTRQLSCKSCGSYAAGEKVKYPTLQ